MASNSIIEWSSSSSHVKMTYEVFVSFRGDTRNNFTGHLSDALRRKGIHFFKDDTKLQKGKPILPELEQAIEGSRILVVVFSKEYASSKWCLRELVNIARYIDISGKHVLPVFYDVGPSEVRNQSGNYEKAFDEYEERFKDDKEKMEEVQTWKGALTRVANLSGWDIGNKPQDAEIEKIVQNIMKILSQDNSNHLNDDLIGMESRIEELEKLLLLDLTDVVRVVGICGMPGIGKTTLVSALYERFKHQYALQCFIADVSKSFRDSSTLGTQKLLLSQALNEKNLEIDNVWRGTHLVRTRLRHARALIVLDNVDHIDQLNKLTLNHKCLGAGSRIIIISRDEHILTAYGVDHVYRVKPLNDAQDWYTHKVVEVPSYINAAFRSSITNEVYLFMKNKYVRLNYAPGTTDDYIVYGPHLICDSFYSLINTPFGEQGIDCAFDTDHNEAFIFAANLCALIDYAPGTTDDKILLGPMTIAEMFPFFKGTVFENGIDAAFRSTMSKEAYLFRGEQYALINYGLKNLVNIHNISATFPSLRGTIFASGIDAAFASHIKDEAYLFKGENYACINFAPGTTNDYIIGGVKPILSYWPSLRGILPLKNCGLDFHDHQSHVQP